MTWNSYHIHFSAGLGAAADGFLADLYPKMEQQQADGHVRRYFFIRYSEGGPHVRLRISPSATGMEPVQTTLRQSVEASGARLEVQDYDRGAHYFGETLDSVYAELLNVATSKLSLALLQHFGPERRGERWITLTCLLGSCLRDSVDAEDWEQALQEARDFTLRAGRSIGLGPESAGQQAGRRWADTVARAWPQVEAGLVPELIKPVVKLLRRVRRRGPDGHDVAMHALHLLCNKTGFSLAEEHESFATLATVAPFATGPFATAPFATAPFPAGPFPAGPNSEDPS